MAKTYYDQDANWELMNGKTIAILGYGSQGHAHALNLKDSGANVIVGLYEGSKSKKAAEEHGLKVYSVAEAVKQADITTVLIPDEKQADVYKNEIAPNLKSGSALVLLMDSISIISRLFLLLTLMYSWWRRKGRDIWFAVRSLKDRAFRLYLPFIRMLPGSALIWLLLTRKGWARCALVLCRRRSATRRKKIFSASRLFFAAASAS